MTDLGALDFLGEVAGVGGYMEVKKNSEIMTIFDMDCQVLSLDGIRAKPQAGPGSHRRTRRSKSSQTKNRFQAYNSRGLSGTCWEATRSSPVKTDSAGRRFRASSAERRTRSGLLFSCETWARTRKRAMASKPSGSQRYSLTA